MDDPEIKLHCEWLVADLPQTGGASTNIVAETNVVIDATDDKGQKMHATGDKAVYVYAVENGVTNEMVTLTGHAKAGKCAGQDDRRADYLGPHHQARARAENMKMVYWQKPDVASTGTNVDRDDNQLASDRNQFAGNRDTNSSAGQNQILLPATTNQVHCPK